MKTKKSKVQDLYPDVDRRRKVYSESQTLTELKKITELLAPPLSAITRPVSPDSSVHEMEKGTAMTFNLHHDKNVAVARTFFSNGSIFPTHSHDQREFIVVYVGSIVLMIAGKEKTLNVGEAIIINAGLEHSAYFLEDSWVIAVTVPAAPGFPGSSDDEEN